VILTGVYQSSNMSESSRLFRLVHSQNIKELGTYTQVDNVEGRYDQRSRQIIECVRPDQLLPSDIIFPDLRMYPQAKYTDIIYPGMFGHEYFALSLKAVSVLSKLSPDTYQTFDCIIHRQNESKKYFIIYIASDKTDEYVDWKNSIFTYWQSFGHMERGQIYINNLDDYLEKQRKLFLLNNELELHERVSIRMKTLVLNENATFFDLFKLNNPALGIYVSSIFIEFIRNNQLTGFAFESIDEFNAEKQKV
jgi:hypothetical protein